MGLGLQHLRYSINAKNKYNEVKCGFMAKNL